MLKDIHSPEDLRGLSFEQMDALAAEIREVLIETVLRQGGHLASNLGVVELTIALEAVFSDPDDRLVFDVGHQSYVHKLLTGRQEEFQRLRQRGGLSGFVRRAESEADAFSVGHAGTAISAALGMARARDLMGGRHAIAAIVGDGAMTCGMCYEALNDAGHTHTPLIVVLNDNEMSISHNVGALSAHLTHLRQSFAYGTAKKAVKSGLARLPLIGEPTGRVLARVHDALKRLLVEDRFFDALGFQYLGPIDGHDIRGLVRVLRRAKTADHPVLIHVVTCKGKGYEQAEKHPDLYHGVSPDYREQEREEAAADNGKVAVGELIAMAEKDIRVTALTAAMPSGTGLTAFAQRFPDRFFDVGIAEEHLVTTAAGMAASGLKPYVAVYSTFLQRGYDQLLHDVCLEHLPVTLLIDRAGLVGQDGATHQGVFDLSFLRQMPGMVVAAPRDVRDLKRLVQLSAEVDGPMAIRYPKIGGDMGARLAAGQPLKVGQWEELIAGEDVVILAVGRMVSTAMRVSIDLMGLHVACGVIDARFIKPMDEDLLEKAARGHRLVVTLEDGVLSGGFGAGVAEWLTDRGIQTELLRLGVPDRFIEYGTVSEQMAECGLEAGQVRDAIHEKLSEMSAVGQ